MFRFENEFFLYALLIVPVLVGWYLYLQVRRRKDLASYGDLSLLEKLMPNTSAGMRHFRFSLLMFSLTCFLLAAANPQVGSSVEKATRKGVDIMVCFDISNSMLAKDISPNRLEASKMAMSHFIDKLQGDRIGLVIFAGKAFVQLPITTDYAAAKMFINYVTPSLINEQGTDIASALDLAASSMLPLPDEKEENKLANLTSKVILVVSDGEDHFQDAVEMAAEVAKLGMTVHTIGIGSTRGEPIPVRGGTGFKADNEGNTVMTRLNEAILRDIAAAGNGIYVHASNANMGFDEILKKIGEMEKVDLDEVSFARYDSKFQYPLFLGIFLLLIEAFVFAVKPRWRQWLSNLQKGFMTKSSVLILLVMFSGAFSLQAQTRDELAAIRRGNDKFKAAEKLRNEAVELQKKGGEINQHNATEKMKKAAQGFQNAEIDYRKAMEKTKSYDKANYNLGTALYRQGKYADAEEPFKFVSQNESSDKSLRAKAFHNLGNSLLQQKKYQESIDAYKNALKLDPKNMNTKYNLEYARKKLIAQQQQQQQQQNQQNKEQNQQNQNQNQNQGQGEQNKDKNKQQGEEQNQGQDKNQQDKSQGQNGKDKQQQNQQPSQADRQKQQENKRQLDALQQNERQIQQKVQMQQQPQGSKRPQEKDW